MGFYGVVEIENGEVVCHEHKNYTDEEMRDFFGDEVINVTST